MRGDGKHQTFTRYAKRTNNFINICKSLTKKHQQEMASHLDRNEFSDRIKTIEKKLKLTDDDGKMKTEFEKHAKLFSEHFKDMHDVAIKNYLIVNSFYFKNGIFVFFSRRFYQIELILEYEKSFMILCTKFHAVKFHKFANRIEISKSSKTTIIKFGELECQRSFEGKLLKGKIQIIADNLDMLPIYENLEQLL